MAKRMTIDEAIEALVEGYRTDLEADPNRVVSDWLQRFGDDVEIPEGEGDELGLAFIE